MLLCLSSTGYRHSWVACFCVTLFQLTSPSCTKGPQHIFVSLVAFRKSLFISLLRPSLPVLFSRSGARIFQIPENFLFALQWSGERDKRAASKQQGSGTCTAEKCARARSKTPAVNPSKNGRRKWHSLDRFSTKRESKYICEPCKYILIGHGVKRCL